LLLAGGELGEGGEDWGVVVVGVGGNGDLDHFLGNAGELNKVSTTLVDGSNDVLGLIEDVDGVSVFLSATVGEGLLGVSHGEDDGKVLLVGEGLGLVDLKVVLGSDLLVLAGSELSA